MQSRGVGNDVAYIETRSFGVNAPAVFSAELEPEPRKRNCLVKCLMLPYDLLEGLIKKWWEPNENCMHCVKITYWMVLIVGGIISAIMTVVPFL